MSDPRLVDMEPGGENTQYESIREFTVTPAKQTGQLGAGLEHTKSEKSPPLGTLGTDTPASTEDENAQAQKLGMGASGSDKNKPIDDAAARSRRQQGYGPGSGVGG